MTRVPCLKRGAPAQAPLTRGRPGAIPRRRPMTQNQSPAPLLSAARARVIRNGAIAELQPELGAEVPEQEAKMDLGLMVQLRDQMKHQLMEFDTAVHTSQEIFSTHFVEENFAEMTTQYLLSDMEELKCSLQNKTLALQRTQLMGALRNKVKQNDNDSRLIVETMKQIVTLSTAVIDYQQQIREKEQKLTEIKRKRVSLKRATKQKALQIQTMIKKQKEEEAHKKVTRKLEQMRSDLGKERDMTTVIENVFQNIIIGSRVNWAEDPSLKAIVLQLAKNVN
ncbi:centromere protein H [Podargus strigoides]